MSFNQANIHDILAGDASLPIAIVGIACRFPGDACNPERLWDMISKGQNALSEIPKSRLNVDAFYHPHPKRSGTMSMRTGYFLKEDIKFFDAPFFGITAKEAHSMDPQQRFALELAYEALENAGLRICDVAGSDMGCYMGSFCRDYNLMRSRDFEDCPLYEGTSAGAAILANRISWFFDLKGPSFTLDTACSSSLVALHLACQALRAGEAKSALVGATNMMFMPEINAAMSSLHFFSPDGKCMAFDHKANGYARGEGAATIILKPLADAIRDGDVIRAVIRGTGVNQDGRTPGITMPSSIAQEALIRETYARAGLTTTDTAYFETHGTGTQAGDPLEAAAAAAAITASRDSAARSLLIGSVKTNIGHTEGIAGLAGVIKGVYALERGQIPPNLWFEKPNPKIPMKEWKLEVPTVLTPWPTDGLRRASVNSFGYGGTNAHCILDDAYHYLQSRGLEGLHNTFSSSEADSSPESSNSSINNDSESKSVLPKLIVWSSHDRAGSNRSAASISSYISDRLQTGGEPRLNDSIFLGRLAYTLAERRSKLPWTSFTVVSRMDEAREELERPLPPARSSTKPALGFIFTGQGAQWYAMGRELMAYPIFLKSIKDASAYIKVMGGKWDLLLEELLSSESASRIMEPFISQPACTALQVALVDLLEDWGVRPAVVIGHSSGEIAAAYASGAITRESAWKIAYHRGRLSASVTLDGAMLAVALGESGIQPYLSRVTNGRAMVACFNSPSSLTISGDSAAIAQLMSFLEDDQIFNRKLKVKTAYHSHHMESIAQQYLDSIRGICSNRGAGDVLMYSSVSGELVDNASILAKPQYWVSNMVSPVRFCGAMQAALEQKETSDGLIMDIILEVGPHGALQGPIKQIQSARVGGPKSILATTSLLARGTDAISTTLKAAGILMQHGYPLDILRANNPEGRLERPVPLVDLPPYAWNHSTKYWYESPAAKAFRFRERPRTDLLGYRSEFSTDDEPNWRNILRASEVPWIAEHTVQWSVLYPFAGMIVMAIEAILEIAPKTKEIEGVQLRDVAVGAAMIISEDDDFLETSVQLRPWRPGSKQSDGNWREFSISSRNRKGMWIQNCKGLVAVSYAATGNPGFHDEAATSAAYYRDEYRRIASAPLREEDAERIYSGVADKGIIYGKVFKTLLSLASGNFEGRCTMAIPDTKSMMPEQFEYPHLIHPITLDSIFQMFSTGPGGFFDDHPRVPRFVDSITISSKMPSEPGTKVFGYSRLTSRYFNEWTGTIVASDETWREPLVIVEGLKLIDIETMDAQARQKTKLTRELGSISHWDLDIESLPSADIAARLGAMEKAIPDADHALISELELASFVIAKSILRQFTSVDAESFAAPHHRLFYAYLQRQYSLAEQGLLFCQTAEPSWLDTTPAFDESLLRRVAAASTEGEILVHVAAHLPAVLRGEEDLLAVLREDDILSRYYRAGLGVSDKWPVPAEFLRMLSHKKPLRILEVGAGTGAAAHALLSRLAPKSGAEEEADAAGRLQVYTYTDISSGFFGSATDEFRPWSQLLEFKVLDIERDPGAQGIQLGSYDVVLAYNVLHATSSISDSLKHIHAMLKPGGFMILGELTQRVGTVPMTVGCLPGWWNGEKDGRRWGPLLSEKEWDTQLRAHGFGGILSSTRDTTGEHYRCSLMITTATPPPLSSVPPSLVIVTRTDGESRAIDTLIANLTAALGSEGCQLEILTLAEAGRRAACGTLSDTTCLAALEVEKSLLTTINEDEWDSMKSLITRSRRLLWLTRGAAVNSERPELNLIAGLSRTLRSETPDLDLKTLDLDPNQALEENCGTAKVIHVLKTWDHDINEREYAVRDGVLHIERIYPSGELSKLLEPQSASPEPIQLPFREAGQALVLKIRGIGQLDSFHFVEDEEYAWPLGDKDVEVEVRALGLNFYDLMVALGQVREAELGAECAGVVSRVGPGVTKFAVGDRVVTLRFGAFRTMLRNDENLVEKLPDDVSFEQGATMMIAYTTAVHALVNVAHLQEGESVLIHSAAGGFGQAAVMLALHIGAEIFVTVSSDKKKQHMVDTYGIKEDHIFNSRDLSFADGVKRMTRGRGVDVVLNSLAGEAMRRTWYCVAPFGRFVELGKRDINGNTGVDMSPFLQDRMYAGVNLVNIYQNNATLLSKLIRQVMRYFADGVFRPVTPITAMGLSQTEAAFRAMQGGRHMGKVVVTVNGDDEIPVIQTETQDLVLRSDATYLLPGGLGGLGRALARRMARKGAKHIVFTSRTGASNTKARQLLDDLEDDGVRTQSFACDIADPEALRTVISSLRSGDSAFPPICGVVTFAMQLQDTPFERMTAHDFHAAVRPKVQATQNLHDQLQGNDLDFFICMSSLGGVIGSMTQANYNAGNAFQDALAHHRRKVLGLRATSIDLGIVVDAGYAAETDKAGHYIAMGMTGLTEEDVLTAIGVAMASGTGGQDSAAVDHLLGAGTQAIVGLPTGGTLKRGGHVDIDPFWLSDARFGPVRTHGTQEAGRTLTEAVDNLAEKLSSAMSLEEARTAVCETLMRRLARALMIDVVDLDPARPANAYGVDSLVAVEIRAWAFKEVKSIVSVFDVLSSIPLMDLASKIAEGSTLLAAVLQKSQGESS
ncbi:hypothetical protein GQ53DRAFT_861382 [Thozetella sp. PMI_491]|nr:hypothetical protein GQ53DRAFT_861382 [Thozetella sp. PMI_491]